MSNRLTVSGYIRMAIKSIKSAPTVTTLSVNYPSYIRALGTLQLADSLSSATVEEQIKINDLSAIVFALIENQEKAKEKILSATDHVQL